MEFTAPPPAHDPVRGNLPLGTRAEFLSILNRYSCSAGSSQEAYEIAQSVAPSSGGTAVPSASASATPSATAQPTAEPTVPPTFAPPPAPNNGIELISPPTAAPSGGIVTPPPIPTPTPEPSVSLGPVYLLRGTGPPPTIVPKGGPSPSPGASASSSPELSATPVNAPTLGPNQYAILADSIEGSTSPGVPGDAVGNVHLYYGDGVVVADRAHFNGDHTITLSGHPYVINHAQDTVLYADSIVFDTVTQRAALVGGRGATVQGVEQGELYYTARTLTTTRTGLHGDHASFTTCLNPHGGYHIEARKFDLTPGERLIAHDAVIFLGPLAIFFIPFIDVPLRQHTLGVHERSTPILPEMGYDQAEGYYLKTRFGFGSSYYYYGDYRAEYYSKRGLGLGYDGNINRRDNKRQITISVWTIKDRTNNDTRRSQLSLSDAERFSVATQANISAQYSNSFGPNVSLPANFNLSANLNTAGSRTSESLGYNTNTNGPQNQSTNITFTQNLEISPQLRQTFNIADTKTVTSIGDDTSLHLLSETNYSTTAATYAFKIDKTDQTQESVGYNTEPELNITPNINFHQFRFPFTTQLTYGYYTEPQNNFATERAHILFDWPVTINVFRTSLLTAGVNVDQYLYGTGDAKAFVSETASLETAIGTHIVNTMQYNDVYPIGPPDVPFQLLDQIASASKQGQDTIRFFNDDTYMLALSSGTTFQRMAQPVAYEFNVRPSARAYLALQGNWTPGSGNGFDLTNASLITGLGHSGQLEMTTDIDWKIKGRLENKNLYYRITIDNCYQIQAGFNESSKAFNLGFNLLAFPSREASFGIGGTSPTNTGGVLQNFGSTLLNGGGFTSGY